MNYLLDTNIVFLLSRNTEQSTALNSRYELDSGLHSLFISAVSLGELSSLGQRLKFGHARTMRIQRILSNATTIEIFNDDIIKTYGELDAYSQMKLAHRPNPKFSARNMGKNDLWIAATATHYNLTLLTTDRDFEHLDPDYLKLEYVDQATLI